MSMDIGDKVEYKTTDKKGVEKWRSGVIHGVKKAEAVKGPEIVLGYLVDTGKDVSSQQVSYNPRSAEINNRVTQELSNSSLEGQDRIDALPDIIKKVEKQKSLPKSEVITETIRQPEQVEVAPADIRAAK